MMRMKGLRKGKYWASFWDDGKGKRRRKGKGKEEKEILSLFLKRKGGGGNVKGRERGGNGKGEEEKGELLNLFLRWTEARSDLLVIELVIRHRSVGQVWGTFDGEDHWIELLSLLLGHEWGVQLQLYKHVLYPRDRRLQPIGDRLHSYKSRKYVPCQKISLKLTCQ